MQSLHVSVRGFRLAQHCKHDALVASASPFLESQTEYAAAAAPKVLILLDRDCRALLCSFLCSVQSVLLHAPAITAARRASACVGMSVPPPAKFAAIEAMIESLTPDAQLAFSNDKNSLKRMRKGISVLILYPCLCLSCCSRITRASKAREGGQGRVVGSQTARSVAFFSYCTC